ncbi:MAG: hypothetical protein AB3N23_18505 [Paracoccaceae bacterium]
MKLTRSQQLQRRSYKSAYQGAWYVTYQNEVLPAIRRGACFDPNRRTVTDICSIRDIQSDDSADREQSLRKMRAAKSAVYCENGENRMRFALNSYRDREVCKHGIFDGRVVDLHVDEATGAYDLRLEDVRVAI